MFCPVCKCEFRSGFTRCEGCNADLVEDPTEVRDAGPATAGSPAALAVPMADYCGFLDLDEARQARDALRRERIASDILIRETPGSEGHGPLQEEYWLRVEAARFNLAAPILGFDRADRSSCQRCGHEVASEESFCPGCGARFEPS